MNSKTLAECLEKIPNRFRLVSLGWKRSHQLIEGALPLVQPIGRKPEAQALREIASGAFGWNEKEERWEATRNPIVPAPCPVKEEVEADAESEPGSERDQASEN